MYIVIFVNPETMSDDLVKVSFFPSLFVYRTIKVVDEVLSGRNYYEIEPYELCLGDENNWCIPFAKRPYRMFKRDFEKTYGYALVYKCSFYRSRNG